jgi:hypothetical protein
MKLTLPLFLAALLGVVSGCKRARPYQAPHQKSAEAIYEARLRDVSLPVGVTAYSLSAQKPNEQTAEVIAYYDTDFTQQMLREFYQIDMERLGWKEVKAFVTEQEALLIYETPRKIAAISIRTVQHKYRVVIFVDQRVR